MQFQSKAAAYQVLVRPERKRWSPDGTVVLETFPPLTAEFGIWESEYSYQDPMTGQIEKGANVRGHFFDTEIAQEQLGWSDEDRETVEKVLVGLCNKMPEYIWPYKETPIAAPWPTYDKTHHNEIPSFAEKLGLAESALAYERQNKNRDSVVEKLESLLKQDVAEEELTAV